MRKHIVALLAIGLMALTASSAMALSSYKSAFLTQYPTKSGTVLNSCVLCHTGYPATSPSINTVNAYGNDYANNGYVFTAIEALDSDGDGFTNIAEINANTFPGDAASKPAAAAVRGDFNGDGKPDLLWRNTTTGQNLVWYMNGTTSTGAGNLPGVAANANWTIAGVGDFNADGKMDIIWRNTSTGQNLVWYMNGVTVSSIANLPQVADQAWQIAGIGDFNGDGQPDILWRNTTTGQNLVWYMNGVTVSSMANLQQVADQAWQVVGIGDFNGDGKPDILWRNSTTGQNLVWYMNGATMTGSAALQKVADLTWTVASVGDYNADGKADIIWRNTSTGQNLIWYMNGVTISSTANLQEVPDQAWKIVGK